MKRVSCLEFNPLQSPYSAATLDNEVKVTFYK